MDLPVSFADRTRFLLGDEEYNKLADALNDEQPVTIQFFIQPFSCLFRSCALVGNRLLSRPSIDVYLRSVVSCRMLLCTGSIFHVCGAGIKAIYRRNTLRNA